MKHIQTVLIVLLVAALVYLHTGNKHKVDSLNVRIVTLEAGLKKANDECETRIALVKAGKNLPVRGEQIRPAGPSLADILKKAPNSPERIRKELVPEIVETLNMNTDQERELLAILDEFRRSKQGVYEKAKEEKRFFFEPAYADMINAARKEALERLRRLLGDKQYAVLVEKGFDERLGLRIAQKPLSKAP